MCTIESKHRQHTLVRMLRRQWDYYDVKVVNVARRVENGCVTIYATWRRVGERYKPPWVHREVTPPFIAWSCSQNILTRISMFTSALQRLRKHLDRSDTDNVYRLCADCVYSRSRVLKNYVIYFTLFAIHIFAAVLRSRISESDAVLLLY